MAGKKSLSLSVRLAAMISIFALLIMAIVGLTTWVARAQKGDATAVNFAGRQRMLTQKFTKEFLQEVNDRQVVASAEMRASTATAQIKADRAYYT